MKQLTLLKNSFLRINKYKKMHQTFYFFSLTAWNRIWMSLITNRFVNPFLTFVCSWASVWENLRGNHLPLKEWVIITPPLQSHKWPFFCLNVFPNMVIWLVHFHQTSILQIRDCSEPTTTATVTTAYLGDGSAVSGAVCVPAASGHL